MDTPCEQVSSFGGLRHFRQENQPQGAADNCLDCSVEAECPYSAKRIYLGDIHKATPGFLRVLTPEVDQEQLVAALRNGPYGRCVYRCDNNVVDHQVVNMQFSGGRTAAFTMTAFTKMEDRKTRILAARDAWRAMAATSASPPSLTTAKRCMTWTRPKTCTPCLATAAAIII